MTRITAALALALMAALASPAVAHTSGIARGDPDALGMLELALVSACVAGVLAIGGFRLSNRDLKGICGLAAVFVIIFGVGPALAETACANHYLDGRPPEITAPPAGARELCQRAFATLYDPARRDPVYSAETLTSASVQAAGNVARGHDFRADERLPAEARATLRDYRGGRFDRGHMAPAADQPDAAAESESFRLSNMVPQNEANNRGPWAGIEESVRTLAVPRFGGGAVHVVSGPGFIGTPERLKGRVAIPQMLWKAVYAPDDGFGNGVVVGAWVVKNAAGTDVHFVSLKVLKDTFGIDPFPSLPADLRGMVELPAGARKRTGV